MTESVLETISTDMVVQTIAPAASTIQPDAGASDLETLQSSVLETVSTDMVLETSPGTSGGNTYTHVQSTPADAWTVTHNLGLIPSAVAVLDSAGTLVLGEIQHVSVNQLMLRFGAAFAGTAYLR